MLEVLYQRMLTLIKILNIQIRKDRQKIQMPIKPVKLVFIHKNTIIFKRDLQGG